MKKALVVLILVSLLISSCRQQKCAAYNEIQIEEVK